MKSLEGSSTGRAITLDQVSRAAGLSRETVSRILNGRGDLYREETRARVHRVCADLGYRPNSMAKAMKNGRFNAIGLLSSRRMRAGQIMPEAVEGIHDVLADFDLHLVSARFPSESDSSLQTAPKMLRELLVDGFLIVHNGMISDEMRVRIDASHAPVVWMNAAVDHNGVRPDDFQGAIKGTQYLLSQGHRRIAFVNLLHSRAEIFGPDMHYSTRDRYEGYGLAMREAGLEPQLICRPDALSEPQSVDARFDWLNPATDRPTAFVFHAMSGMMSAVLQARLLGLRPGTDPTFLVFCESAGEIASTLVDTILVPHRKVGQEAVRLLMRRIADPSYRPPTTIIPCELAQLGSLANFVKMLG